MKNRNLKLVAAAFLMLTIAVPRAPSQTLKTKAYSIETILFQKKNNPQKIYEVTLPAILSIRIKNWKIAAALNGSSLWAYFGKLQSGIITHMNDSIVTIKCKRT